MNFFTWRSTLAVLCALCVSSVLGATTFDDLKTSFAQYKKWIPPSSSQGLEGKLSFLFKTHVRDSILLYQDDGGRDYLSVELLSAKVLLSFGSSGNSVRVQIGHDLADMLWHKVVVQLNNDQVILTLDQNLTQTATIPRPRNEALLGNSGFLYIGGFPSSLSLSQLSTPQVAFKKRFVGCIKRIMMTNTERVLERAVLIKSKGTKSGCLNECRVRNPCLNNGKCVNRFSKAKCDCSGTGFEGKRCEKGQFANSLMFLYITNCPFNSSVSFVFLLTYTMLAFSFDFCFVLQGLVSLSKAFLLVRTWIFFAPYRYNYVLRTLIVQSYFPVIVNDNQIDCRNVLSQLETQRHNLQNKQIVNKTATGKRIISKHRTFQNYPLF